MSEVKRLHLRPHEGNSLRMVTIAVNAPHKIEPEQLKELLAAAVEYGKCAMITDVSMPNFNQYNITFAPGSDLFEAAGLKACEYHVVEVYTAIVEELDAVVRYDRLRASLRR